MHLSASDISVNKSNVIPVHNIEVKNPVKSVKVTSNASANDKIYIRAVKGKIETFRRIFGFVFLAMFALLPWLTYNGQQAVLLDFSAQRFHFFGLTLWPQDLTLFAWIFIIAAFALFCVTAIAGRVWCGFMCPQTVFTFLFVWVEEKVEGGRNKRIHLDNQPMHAGKLARKLSKHLLWLTIALLTALIFVGYFYPIDTLFINFATFELDFWPLFYVALFTLCTYGNAGWMREIMCTHICPYSRFQSSMFDKNTFSVTYDRARGEGRGPRSKKLGKEERHANGLGDCIDCNLCVQVCPTGIDIRNGLQYECINCGACVDACTDVMNKMNYEPGLIRFTSESALEGSAPNILRPKVVGYFLVLCLMMGLLFIDIYTRPSLDLDVVKDRRSLHRVSSEGAIENSFTLILMNKSQKTQDFNIDIEGLHDAHLIGSVQVRVAPGELVSHPMSVSLPVEKIVDTVSPFHFVITNAQREKAMQNSTFIYL